MIDIIPAMDLINGACVRLVQGDFARSTQYSSDPVSIAQMFEDIGLSRLHMVDLDGARNGRITNLHILQSVAKRTNLKIDFSGGIRNEEDIQRVIDAGASIVAIGSLSVTQRERVAQWIEKYGASNILLGADVKNNLLSVHGWQQQENISIVDYLKYYQTFGRVRVFCTDIEKDGMMAGPAIDLYDALCSQFIDINIIASGGITTVSDIVSVAQAGCKGVIIGKALYEGTITKKDLIPFLK